MNKLVQYFQLNRKEQRGYFFLIWIIFLLLLGHIFLPVFYPPEDINILIKHFPEEILFTGKAPKSIKPVKNKFRKALSFFPFDPNTLDKAGWEKLGLSDKQAQVIINYRNKGGKFYKKEDLRKIYSLDSMKIQELLPYVIISKMEERPSFANIEYPKEKNFRFKKAPEIIELNSSDSLGFISLNGIGPVYSKRIIKFREALGGFVRLEQISEVYGIPAETYVAILPYLKLDLSLVKKIDINSVNVNDLGKHPYIKYKRARTIINYRDQHGAFKSLSDLRNIHSLDEEFFSKIELYLEFR
ncbi:ComEA family DNA-binding protein [Sphingobacterium cellulitidis]|uniref:ComEA family DNA-binding protein n=1 Tax=Sphingobacterium cellulitidis TaxID=1768011 RepID=UPI003C7B0FA3